MSPTTQTLVTGAFQGSLVAEQNDRFRTTWGMDPTMPGRTVITSGVDALSFAAKVAITKAVATFSEFTEDNDPFGLRDFGAFEVEDGGVTVRLYWKIDLYDVDYRFGSEAPDDPARTRRLLTILLPEEW